MNIHTELTPDVVGLTKVAPFSRRGFMTASAAVAAGYTLAAGPVRADVITTSTDGLDAGDIKIKVADGEMPGYFARPKGVANPPVILVAMEIFGLHEYIKDACGVLPGRRARVAPDYYYRKRRDLTKITAILVASAIVNASRLLGCGRIDSTAPGPRCSAATPTGRHRRLLPRRSTPCGNTPPIDGVARGVVLDLGRPGQSGLADQAPNQLAPDMKALAMRTLGEADTGIPVATGASLGQGRRRRKRTNPPSSKIYRRHRTAPCRGTARAIARERQTRSCNQMQPGSRSTRCSARSSYIKQERRAVPGPRAFFVSLIQAAATWSCKPRPDGAAIHAPYARAAARRSSRRCGNRCRGGRHPG